MSCLLAVNRRRLRRPEAVNVGPGHAGHTGSRRLFSSVNLLLFGNRSRGHPSRLDVVGGSVAKTMDADQALSSDALFLSAGLKPFFLLAVRGCSFTIAVFERHLEGH